MSRSVYFLLSFLISLNFSGYGQETDTSAADISHFRFEDFLGAQSFIASTAKGSLPDREIPTLNFRPDYISHDHPRNPPDDLMEKDIYIRVNLYNSSDTTKEVCFLPSFYCRDIYLFKSSVASPVDSFRALPYSVTRESRYAGVRRIKLNAHEQAIFYCKFNFVRTNVNLFAPYLIEKDYLSQWLTSVRDRDRMLDIVTYVNSGILLLMIFYSLAVYIQNKNKEFIYYAVYTFLTASLLFLKSYLSMNATAFNYFYEEYLDFMTLTASVFTYLIFVRRFINAKENHKQLNNFLKVVAWFLIFSSIVFAIIYFFTSKYIILNIMENFVMKLIFFFTGVIFIIYSIKKKNTLLYYLAGGNAALVVFSLMSQGIILYKWKFVPDPSIINRALFYYETGLVLELIFFLSGLAYKNRRDIIDRVKERERLKLENERKEFDKLMAVMAAKQEERDRISADMHDELGSGVTHIRLMSEIVKNKIKDQHYNELEKISNSANDLLGKMNTIIWTMKSSNDTLESLVAYIRVNAIEFFDNTPIECSVKTPNVIPQVDISGEKRRNIFLSVKEALNNAMKHSQATHIIIEIMIKGSTLIIKISDDGVGIDTEKLRRFGNGLNNMKRRMESIEGSFKVENNGSAMITFEVPI
jgi:signal transduction histidine kinase